MSDKLELREKIQAVDLNIRELWDGIDEENQKLLKSEFYILNRYISNVKGQPSNIQEHFVLTVNEYFNKNWASLQKHPKLLWLLLCMCNYNGEKKFFHEWIPHKKAKSNSKKIKFIEELHPDKSAKELELLSTLYTEKELRSIARDLGLDDSEIAKKFK